MQAPRRTWPFWLGLGQFVVSVPLSFVLAEPGILAWSLVVGIAILVYAAGGYLRDERVDLRPFGEAVRRIPRPGPLATALLVALVLVPVVGPLSNRLYETGRFGEPAGNRFMRAYEMGFNDAGRYGLLVEFGVNHVALDGIHAGLILSDGRDPEVENFWFAAPGTRWIPPQGQRHEPGVSLGVQIDGERAIGRTLSDIGPTPDRSFYIYVEDDEPIQIRTCAYASASEITAPDCEIQ